MKEYDEFGRPIYETAEEYNQAHRNAQHMHTYETLNDCKDMHKTASQRYENQNRMKKTMTVAGMGVGIFIAMIMVIIGLMANVSDDSTSYEEEDVTEYYGDDSTPLPEDFATFSLDGQSFTLPIEFEAFQDLDYSMSMDFDEEDLLPPGFDDNIEFYDEEDNLIAIVGIQNITDEEIPLGKCEVNYFHVENPAAFYVNESVPDFVFASGFTFESYYHQLESYFGEPYYHYEDHSEEGYYYDSYDWTYYGEDELHYISVTFWNGEISDVSIQKITWE